MSSLPAVFLLLTLLLCGAYAGMVLMCQIGVLPALRDLPPRAYANAWRAMDKYMDRSMPPYKGTLLLVNAVACALLLLQQHTQLGIAVASSLAFSLAGLVATVRGQLPLNAKMKSLPADAPESVLLDIRERTIKGFTVRFFLAVAAFLSLSIGVIYWPLR